MLGFILSKMQMLIFAIGVAVVCLMFYDFVSKIGLIEPAQYQLLEDAKAIDGQISAESPCSFDVISIPEVITYGYDQKRFYYELGFSKQSVGSGENIQNKLILSIVEHKKDPKDRSIVVAKSVASRAEFRLVDSKFLLEGSNLDSSYDSGTLQEVFYYPRAASKTEQESAPNSFVAFKDTILGKEYLYIIPCSTRKEANNCLRNILRLGCHILKTENPNKTNDTMIPSCFNISTQASDSSDKQKEFTWGDCQTFFPDVTGSS
jgi:hypothetical protein